jgi:hypothetical protein
METSCLHRNRKSRKNLNTRKALMQDFKLDGCMCRKSKKGFPLGQEKPVVEAISEFRDVPDHQQGVR